jgi:pimeloyl-ACP methyl ester carboxylesterase
MKFGLLVGLSFFVGLNIDSARSRAQPSDELVDQVVTLPTVTAERIGEGGREVWIFTPAGVQLAQAPVVVFVHGWGAMDPYLYGGWILHLIRRGNIVIYPRYQENLTTLLDEMTPNAVESVQHAFQQLATTGSVLADCDRVAIVGHSMGGFIATNLAADSNIPVPKAVMIIAPGDGEDQMPRLGERLVLADPSGLSSDTLFLLVTGDADTVVGNRGATKIWSALQGIPRAGRMFAVLASDYRLSPSLLADHLSPLAVDRSFPEEPTDGGDKRPLGVNALHQRWAARFAPDALDYDGYWKMFDELLDTAFYSTSRSLSLEGFASEDESVAE